MKKKIILYTILCIFCFLLGLALPKSNKLALTDYIYVNDTRIIVEENVNQNIANQYIENLKTLPDFLVNNCHTIIITNENLNEKFNFGFTNVVLAVTVDDIIYINDSKYKSDVLIHELFHVYDYANNWISINNSDFLNIYELEKNIIQVSPGNNETPQEFFATIGAEYYLNKEDLKEFTPKSFEFINSLKVDEN